MRNFRFLLRPSLLLILGTLSLPASAEVHGPLGASLDRYMKSLAGYGYSGAVLVAKGGQVILNQGYGLADRGRKTPFTTDTLFDIASISKQFTAAAVLRLEMQGKLKVEDRLGKFFPSAPPDKAAITLHDLLTHTAGLPESVGDEYQPLSREDFLKKIFAAPLRHPPGKRFEYSNAGYSLLAAVVEAISKRSLGEFLRDEVFLKAGMRHTGFLPDAADRPRLAHGYTVNGDWGTPLDQPMAPDGPWWNLRGNGGILTTTGDLYLWNQALQGDAVLSAPEREKYQRPYVRETGAPEPRYAYGWSILMNPRPMIAHVGGNGAFNSDLRRYPKDGVMIFASTNTADFAATITADQLERRVFGQSGVVEPPAIAAASKDDLQRCAGAYKLASGEGLKVTAEGDRLAIAPEGHEGLAVLFGTPGKNRQRRFEERNHQVGQALEAAKSGNLSPLGEILNLDPERTAERWRSTLAGSKKELGDWKGATVIGTESNGGGIVVTYARLAFAKGTRVLKFSWSGPNAESLGIAPGLPPAYFLPEGPGRFATYDLGTDLIGHLTCAGAKGPATALRFETAGGVVEARRAAN